MSDTYMAMCRHCWEYVALTDDLRFKWHANDTETGHCAGAGLRCGPLVQVYKLGEYPVLDDAYCWKRRDLSLAEGASIVSADFGVLTVRLKDGREARLEAVWCQGGEADLTLRVKIPW